MSAPDDLYEREADRAADQVLRMPEARVQRACACASGNVPCPKCEEEGHLRRRAGGAAEPTEVAGDFAGQLGAGHPLDPDVRAFFEPRYGADFGGVRVHADERADASARSVNALAFTLGRHVVFGAGQYAPHSGAGRRLLAHELAHVVQASGTHAGTDAPLVRRREAPAGKSNQAPQPGREGPGGGGHVVAPTSPRPTTTPRSETCPPPKDMLCPPATSSPGPVTNTLRFSSKSAVLSNSQRAEIATAAASWHAAGGSVTVRVDGYASAEGECGYNWKLSCRRVEAVVKELIAPTDRSPGVPIGNLEAFAHGESGDAGRELPTNRRATISIPPPSRCQFPVLLGTGRTGCREGEDFKHFDFPTIKSSSAAKLRDWARALYRRQSRWDVTDDECKNEMRAVLVLAAGTAGVAAFSHFVTGAGEKVLLGATSSLGKLALTSPSFRQTVEKVKIDLAKQLARQAASGPLDPCALTVVPPETHFPLFKGSDPWPLKAVIGGTHGEQLFADSFTGSLSKRSYSIGLRFLICDNFGVDEKDLYFEGLLPFWVLQHERSATLFFPFVNELELPVKVQGTF